MGGSHCPRSHSVQNEACDVCPFVSQKDIIAVNGDFVAICAFKSFDMGSFVFFAVACLNVYHYMRVFV